MITVWIEKQRAKAVLLQVFKSGNIGAAYKYGKTNGTIYPKIRNVHFDSNKKAVLYTFSLPVGMDPKEMKKRNISFNRCLGRISK